MYALQMKCMNVSSLTQKNLHSILCIPEVRGTILWSNISTVVTYLGVVCNCVTCWHDVYTSTSNPCGETMLISVHMLQLELLVMGPFWPLIKPWGKIQIFTSSSTFNVMLVQILYVHYLILAVSLDFFLSVTG